MLYVYTGSDTLTPFILLLLAMTNASFCLSGSKFLRTFPSFFLREKREKNGSFMDNRTPFEIEHGTLLEQVAQGLDQLVANLKELNRNLETINTIGREFTQASHLWRDFHEALMVPNADDENAAEKN